MCCTLTSHEEGTHVPVSAKSKSSHRGKVVDEADYQPLMTRPILSYGPRLPRLVWKEGLAHQIGPIGFCNWSLPLARDFLTDVVVDDRAPPGPILPRLRTGPGGSSTPSTGLSLCLHLQALYLRFPGRQFSLTPSKVPLSFGNLTAVDLRAPVLLLLSFASTQ